MRGSDKEKGSKKGGKKGKDVPAFFKGMRKGRKVTRGGRK